MSTPEQSTALPVPELRSEFTGEVIGPEDPGYDEARTVFLRGIDRRPAAIVRVADAADVSRVISLARDTGLELAVRSGGHSRGGQSVSDGGIVLDLTRMRALQVDPEARTAWAESGMTAGDYTAATGEHGLATGLGDAATVGLGGITLGGGVGYLLRKNGLTIDDLLAAELVTADGSVVEASPDSEPDLFWAIRGGGGNFGVATRFKLRLHPISEIVGGMLMLPASPDVIASFVAEAEGAPEELSTIANVMPAPPMPFVPAEHHGRPVVMSLMAYAGPAEEGERAIAPLRALATPIADMVKPIRYPELYEGEGPSPVLSSATNLFADSIDRGDAEAILEQLEASTAPMTAIQLRVLGGAMARVPADETAFAHRDRRIMVNIATMYERPEEAPVHEAWVAGLADTLRDGEPGAYVGFLGNDDEAKVREAYPGSTWDRLAQIKARYDPANLFRLNQNIPPAASTG